MKRDLFIIVMSGILSGVFGTLLSYYQYVYAMLRDPTDFGQFILPAFAGGFIVTAVAVVISVVIAKLIFKKEGEE